MKNLKEEFKGLQIIHLSFVMGIVLMAGLFIYMSLPMDAFSIDLGDPFTLAALAFGFGGIGLSTFLANRKRGEAFNVKGVEAAVLHYKTSMLMRMMPLEIASLISVVFFFLSNNPFFLAIVALCWFLLLINRPTLEELKNTYQLSSDELEQLS